MDETVAKRDNAADVRYSACYTGIQTKRLIQGFTDYFRLPFNGGLEHLIIEEIIQTTIRDEFFNTFTGFLDIK